VVLKTWNKSKSSEWGEESLEDLELYVDLTPLMGGISKREDGAQHGDEALEGAESSESCRAYR
jgi:hypothetical protein